MNFSKFCESYAAAGIQIAQVAVWFLWAALAVAVAVAIAEIIAKLRPAVGVAPAPGAGGAVVTLIDAIKGLVTALAAAPLWIALFAAGILVFTMPGVTVSAACTKTENGATDGKAPLPKPSPTATATSTPTPTGTPK